MILLDYTLSELTELFADIQPYKVKQLYKWLYRGADFDEMTDLPKEWRQRLKSDNIYCPVTILKKFESNDGTQKFLY